MTTFGDKTQINECYFFTLRLITWKRIVTFKCTIF